MPKPDREATHACMHSCANTSRSMVCSSSSCFLSSFRPLGKAACIKSHRPPLLVLNANLQNELFALLQPSKSPWAEKLISTVSLDLLLSIKDWMGGCCSLPSFHCTKTSVASSVSVNQSIWSIVMPSIMVSTAWKFWMSFLHLQDLFKRTWCQVSKTS